jgi:hypothetical protein
MKLSLKESKGLLASILDVVVKRHGSVEAYARSRGVGAEGLRKIRGLEKSNKR